MLLVQVKDLMQSNYYLIMICEYNSSITYIKNIPCINRTSLFINTIISFGVAMKTYIRYIYMIHCKTCTTVHITTHPQCVNVYQVSDHAGI